MSVLLLVSLFAAGCGSSGGATPASPIPKRTALPHFTDRSAGITVSVTRAVSTRSHALLFIRMRNASSTSYVSAAPVPFRDTAFVQPTSGSTASACDSDESLGTGLQYATIPAHVTRSGWIRCDYPSSARIFVLIWNGHVVGSFRI
jgi:hypothetical protein